MSAATAEILETTGEKPFNITLEDGWIGSFSCVDEDEGDEDEDDDEDEEDEDEEDVPPKGDCTGIHAIFIDGASSGATAGFTASARRTAR
jgi:hypothetical protein